MKLLFLTLLFAASCQKTTAKNPENEGPFWKTDIAESGEVFSYNEGDMFLEPLAPDNLAQPTLIGGTPADPKDWPASFTSYQGNSRCTGTLIGPKVLQLAAHCVGNGKKAKIIMGGTNYEGTCTHSPDYKSDATADYALCFLSQAVPVAWYEVILTDPLVKLGDELILAGMGGTKVGGSGGNDNVFRVGAAPVIRLPNQSSNDIITQGKSALAFGDSGGSAYWKDKDGNIKVVGINSRGNIKDTSYLSATFTADAVKFYNNWINQSGAEVCGITANMQNCRSLTPPPGPSPVPEWCKATYEMMNKCVFGNPRLSLTQRDMCRDEYAKFFACQEASELEE